jgi:DNA-binding NarL/FixJ family response regulator
MNEQPTVKLTGQEKRILKALVTGHVTNDQIATALKMKERAVRRSMEIIFAKLGVNDRASLMLAVSTVSLVEWAT